MPTRHSKKGAPRVSTERTPPEATPLQCGGEPVDGVWVPPQHHGGDRARPAIKDPKRRRRPGELLEKRLRQQGGRRAWEGVAERF